MIVIPSTYRLLESFEIDIPARDLSGKLYQVPHRDSGRRAVVFEAGVPVYDTDDCYDLGNATNKLDQWLALQM